MTDREKHLTTAHRAFLDPGRQSGTVGVKRSANAMHGSCTTPVKLRFNETDKDHELSVRCRSCPGCLRSRRFLWQMRAEAEMLFHQRTFFFTGTFAKQTNDIEVVKRATTNRVGQIVADKAIVEAVALARVADPTVLTGTRIQ